MFKKIMVPIDLVHIDKLEKGINTAIDLAKHYGIPICFVGVTPGTPSEVAHNPKEHAEKLAAFGAEQGQAHGLAIETESYASHDPAVDLDETLIDAASKTGADLIVMASHKPGLPEHLIASDAGHIASHAEISVFVVR